MSNHAPTFALSPLLPRAIGGWTMVIVHLFCLALACATAAAQSSPSDRESTADGLPDWKPIGSLTTGIRAREQGELPRDRAATLATGRGVIHFSAATPADPCRVTLLRTPAGVHHQPLCFEDVNLERYGHSHGLLQPVVSGAKFFATVPVLPYKMTVEPPCACVATDCLPPAGRCAPPQHISHPLDLNAAVVQTAVIVGLIALIP